MSNNPTLPLHLPQQVLQNHPNLPLNFPNLPRQLLTPLPPNLQIIKPIPLIHPKVQKSNQRLYLPQTVLHRPVGVHRDYLVEGFVVVDLLVCQDDFLCEGLEGLGEGFQGAGQFELEVVELGQVLFLAVFQIGWQPFRGCFHLLVAFSLAGKPIDEGTNRQDILAGRQRLPNRLIIHNIAARTSNNLLLILLPKPDNLQVILACGQTVFIRAFGRSDALLEFLGQLFCFHFGLVLIFISISNSATLKDNGRVYNIIQYLEMINNPIAATLQQKILAQMAELHKKKAPEEKISYIKLNQKQEEEAEELFDLVEPISKAERKRNQGKGKTEDQKVEEEEQEQEEQEQEEEEKPKVEENKFISILKKTEKGKQLIEGTKKVTFADQPESYLVTQSGRKWNEKLRTQRKGKFDPAQKRLLIQNLSQCLSQANLRYDEVVRTMSEDEEKIPRNLNFWTKVCSILPDRTLVSSYKFLKRELDTKNKGGEWTEDETNQLIELVEKVGRKWSLIAKEMHRSAENVRDKYRLIGEQKYDPSSEQTVWKFAELVQFLAYVQKYSKVQFLDPQISTQLQSHQQHDQLQLQQLKTRRYNSKTFNFHNNTVARRYIKKQFNSLKIESINWQKISDKLGTKTIFDCRNKFVQLLQLEICGMGSQEYYQGKIVDFVLGLRVKYQGEIDWGKWTEEGISGEEARNRWMILKRHVQGRGQKTFQQLMAQLAQKYSKKQK